MARIMVVDDVSIMRFTIKGHLQRLGHEVVAEASNGDEAINQYMSTKPDLVTMDITMPAVNDVRSGIEALVKIREFDKNAKVIMITSHGEEKLVMEALTKGAKGYVLKPITEDKLRPALAKVIS
jgi:two-component system chemotaxis response regulator CheY